MRLGAGLCDHCQHQRIVRTTRGSAFSLCEQAKVDARLRKYPPIPVLQCPAFVRREDAPER